MKQTKILIATLIHVALGVLIIVAIWPALHGSSDGYTGAIAITPPSPPPVVEEEVVEVSEPNISPVLDVTEEDTPDIETIVDNTQAVDVITTETATKENENSDALYSVVDGNKLDANSYAGFKLYRNWCARCHGTYGQGMVGPNLAESLKFITEKEFFETVEKGKSGTIGSMPTWRANVKVMAGRDQLYAYLMARSDGAIGIIKPKKQ